MRHTAPLAVALTLLSVVPACSQGGGHSASATGGTGFLTIEATDKPFDHSLVEEARLRIDHVSIEKPKGGKHGWLTLYEGKPLAFDLLDLRNGVVRTLVALAPIPAGEYRKMRLHVAGGRLLLTNGNVYTTDDGTLELKSQPTGGFQIYIKPSLTITDQVSYKLLLDFDLTKTFKPKPGGDPENAVKFVLHPKIRVANLSESGEMAGTVVADDGSGNLVGVELATVYILPEGSTNRDDAVASTGTNANGNFRVLGILPGVYDLMATADERMGTVLAQTVALGSQTQVEILIE